MGTIKFSIPKPCNEEWNKMSPQEQGRFCDKCSKTVVDFSSKTTDEVQSFISDHSNQKICGRFRNTQLDRPVKLKISLNSYINKLNYSKALFLSLLIAFGTTLFSCTTHTDETIGKIGIIVTEGPDSTPPPPIDIVENTLTGEVIMQIPSTPDPLPAKQKIKKIASPFPLLDTTIDLPSVEITGISPPISECFTVGALSVINTERQENLIDSGTDVEKSIPDIENPADNSVLYPNPTNGIVNLKINLPSEKNVSIELFDINGKNIRSLLQSQNLQEGESDFQFDISNLMPATYFVRITKDNLIETKRIVVM